ncbi:MAG: hypothetical protein IPG89_03275 [Bacteroidetes bacterium]|nr:hypothetical protein [Bacteroidota bacterium]
MKNFLPLSLLLISIMFKILKINTAIILVIVFFFKLLVVDFNVIFSIKSIDSRDLVKENYSESKRTQLYSSTENSDLSLLEICEEDTDGDDDEIKLSSFLVTNLLFVLSDASLRNGDSSILHFNNYKFFTYSYRYLQLQVFRI